MKKLLSCLLVFCMLFSLGIYNTYVTTTQIKANDINVEIINEPLEGEEFNHVFTQKELKGTEYEGKDVKIVNGEVYVDGRSAGIAIYLLVQNVKWVLVGLMANGTIQALVEYGPEVEEAYGYAKEIWAIYQNRVKTVYANVAAKTASASLKDGNICVRQSPNHYVCGYSLRPEEDSD